jgi:hypothetical protein
MKRSRMLALATVALSCCQGCGNGNGNDNQTSDLQRVTFVNKGAVASAPVIRTVAIDRQTISYWDTQAGQPISSWSRQVKFADYSSIQRTVKEYNLLEAGNVTLPVGHQGCVGASGMTITMTTGSKVYSFDISAEVSCNRNLWPEGVRNLVNLEDALIAQYSAQEVSFSSLVKGQVPPSGSTSAQITVIRNGADWATFWDQLHANLSPKPALPPVNFAESAIVALVDTARTTGGYSVTITGIKHNASGVTVSASQVSPGPTCVVTQAFTQPFHIVTTPLFSGAVTLELSQSVTNCGQ